MSELRFGDNKKTGPKIMNNKDQIPNLRDQPVHFIILYIAAIT
ncbi:hypothetical protein IMCC1989_2336 [gamma proteobacterium IMCC1989]|nr:hypothetical protein IMCC1989_2336 [gamma proteobacterium IMCC1989]